jgi:hypothetical protein
LRPLAVHERRDGVRIASVAADQPVRAKLPDVAGLAPGRRTIDQPIVLGIAGLLGDQAIDQAVDLSQRESGQSDVEAEVDFT